MIHYLGAGSLPAAAWSVKMGMPIQEPEQKDLDRIAGLLKNLRSGSKEAAGQLVAAFCPELRRMRSERTPHTWQPTVLVNELYLELLKIRAIKTDDDGSDREAFLGLAAHIMRRLLIHHARPLHRQVEQVELRPAVVDFGGQYGICPGAFRQAGKIPQIPRKPDVRASRCLTGTDRETGRGSGPRPGAVEERYGLGRDQRYARPQSGSCRRHRRGIDAGVCDRPRSVRESKAGGERQNVRSDSAFRLWLLRMQLARAFCHTP